MASIQDRSTPHEARWRVRWRDGRAAAHTHSHTFTSPLPSRGQSEAAKAAKRLKAYVDLIGHHLEVIDALLGAGFRVAGVGGPEVEPEPEGPPIVTVAEYATRWLAGLVRPNPRTREDYRTLLERHVLPALGDRDIAELRREDIALWLRSQEDSNSGRGKAPALHSIANRHGVLSAMLTDAATDGLRTGNPAKGLGPTPKSLHRDMCFLTHQEWAIMHRALYRPPTHQSRDDPTLGQDLATLLVGSGVRYGEATALSVEQCDLLAPRAIIRIDRAWKRQADGTYAIAEPKSRRSVRSIDVPEQVRDVLISRTIDKEPTDLVFVTPRTGGHYLSSWFWDRYWKHALDRAREAGLRKRPRVHDLRHTHASWLISDGRPLASIQRRLGHESITTTIDRYGHLMPELEAGNAAAIERAMAAVALDVVGETPD